MAKYLRKPKKPRTVYVMTQSFPRNRCGTGLSIRNDENNKDGVRKGDEIVILEGRWVKHKKTGMEFKCDPYFYQKVINHRKKKCLRDFDK